MTEIRTFRAMGCEVVVGGASDSELEAVRRLFAFREAVFSRFRRDSELELVNASDARVLVVSQPFAHALREAIDAAAATAGLVDPTIAAALEAAGYDRDFAELFDDGRPPEPPPRAS